MLRKRFSFLGVGWMPLLMSVLLVGALSFATAQAAPRTTLGIDTVGAQAPMAVSLQNKTVQDSVVMSTFKLAVYDTLTSTSDSVAVTFNSGDFVFAKKGPYKVTVNGSLKADSARVMTGGTTLYIKISGPVRAGNADTLTVAGVYIKANTTALGTNDSLSDNLAFHLINGASSVASADLGGTIALLPGSIYNVAITSQPASSVQAGSNIAATVSLTDKFGNASRDKSTSVGVAAVLNGTSTLGNGTLGGTSSPTKTVVVGSGASDTYAWSAMTYTKAEAIQLVFTAPGGKATSTAITVNPGPAANLAVTTPSSEAFTVGGSPLQSWVATVTDANSNPINTGAGTYVVVTEKTPHGGAVQPASSAGATFTTDSAEITVSGGKTGNIAFLPSNYYTGKDTLVFTLTTGGSTKATFVDPGIVISAGPVAGVIVDYAGSANGSAVSEAVAAGAQVYARAFLRDTYGNPVNATGASQITFTKGVGKGSALGTPALTSAITESQYPNSNKTAIGVAIPYTVSQKVVTNSDTVTATAGSYSKSEIIQNRSNVPAKIKLAEILTDSSLVASNYSNTFSTIDTVWDQYGNLCVSPGKVTLAPTSSKYAIYFSTKGLVDFVRTTVTPKDTISADTLYPAAGGLVSESVFSGKKSGMDTLKLVAAANSAVTASAPIWITPASVSQIVLSPAMDTTAVAGAPLAFTAQTEDAYGNHVDWGFPGGQSLTQYKTAFYTKLYGGKPDTSKINPNTRTDLANLAYDTVSTGHNRGGHVNSGSLKTIGSYALGSIGGNFNATFGFTPYTAGPDTQKVYVKLNAMTDTSLVRSAVAGALNSFAVTIAPASSMDTLGGIPAGDSIKVSVTPKDISGNTIYTYQPTSLAITVTNAKVSPMTSKDSTFYFIYVNEKKDTLKSTGASIKDTIGTGGAFSFYLRKFTAENVAQRVKIVAGSVADSSTKTFTYVPLSPKNAYGKWSVAINTDTVSKSSSTVSFTVTPRDKYYNVNTKDTTLVDITTNLSSGTYNFGGNPQVIIGPTTLSGALANGASSVAMKVTIFTTDNLHIFGSGSSSIIDAIEGGNNIPKTFALDQNYPNPFNPTTTIRYDVPKNSNVRIVIYDILGREVRTLVSKSNVAPGHYTAVWNGMNSRGQQVSSGVYFYRMEAGSFISLKKMLLLK